MKNKRRIKINFVGFYSGWQAEDNPFVEILKERYIVEISDRPDYIFCSLFGEPYAYTRYDCVRIFNSGENYTPDFNLVDYSIGSDRLVFEDRYFRYPICIHNLRNNRAVQAANRKINKNDFEILAEKSNFCNFIYSHKSEGAVREKFFKKLSSYKPVLSAGSFLNNLPNKKAVPYKEKLDCQKTCKFTIAFESTSLNGFCTEKILDAFLSNTIPIYFGDPYVTELFNPKAFLNYNDFENEEQLIQKIKELDNDDKKYMEMLSEPVFNDSSLPQKIYDSLCHYLYYIFDQDPQTAFRRSRVFSAQVHNDRLAAYREPKHYIKRLLGKR